MTDRPETNPAMAPPKSGQPTRRSKMLQIVTCLALAIVVATLLYAASKPGTFRVEREIVVLAPAGKIFALVNDFHNWAAWTPYNKDPEMLKVFSGATSGRGAIYEWEGNSQVGKGLIEITESLPDAKITLKLDFIKPFAAHNTAEFTFLPAGDSTRVRWAMYGPQPYFGKLMSLFFNVDKMVGEDFAKGLAKLKSVVEAQ
jgi:hypothetical protein